MESGSAGRNRRSIEDWRRIVDGKEGSGLGIREYCEKIGVAPTQFYKYQSRLRGKTDAQGALKNRAPIEQQFIELGEVKVPGRGWTVELALSSGVTIRVR